MTQTLFRTIVTSIGTTAMEFYSGERDSHTMLQMGIYSQGAGWGLVDGGIS